ncbi:hypothetical protein M2352_002347 [Azospirillum fermentarium]|uniref:exopolysaccharide biosynthesis protein n=1 Tax=Azospirillum fermentarium TaxID=1233114 RepID=UPI002226F197|nr:exopolysaccharide biosynthesis protein [Azospirillum fermentarium]MCW2246756.1 hypothetical protein [Azospirillum fermentarium]
MPSSPPTQSGADAGRPESVRASQVLDDFLALDHDERIRLGDAMAALGDRAFGAFLILLSVPNVLPVPGLSTVTGLPMLFLGAQIAAGRSTPWLPRRLAAASVERRALLRVLERARPKIAWIERNLLRARLVPLAQGPGERGAGLVIMLMAAVMALPIVFGNQPPAFAIALIALGLIERDGLFVLAGYVAGLAALAIVSAVGLGLFQGAAFVVRQATG